MSRPCILFLPGAGGSPISGSRSPALPTTWPKENFGWPGLGAPAPRSRHPRARRSEGSGDGENEAGGSGRPDRWAGSLQRGSPWSIETGAPPGALRDVRRRRHGGTKARPTGAPTIAVPFQRPLRGSRMAVQHRRSRWRGSAAPTLLIWGDKDDQPRHRRPASRRARAAGRARDRAGRRPQPMASTHADLVARLIAKHLA